MAAAPKPSYRVRVVGAKRATWISDLYHTLLRLPWSATLALVVAAYLTANLAFALVYLVVGGVANARPGSLFDAMSFSVQTMGTIGYGAMYPASRAAQAVVMAESVVGLLATALATGLVFAKFSRPTGRIAFSREAVVTPVDGEATLMFRVGNERGNQIVEATVRVVLVRTVKTREGVTFYRMADVPLRRERSPAMTRSWTVMHTVDAASPLAGLTPADLARDEVEFIVSLVGVDDTSLQPVHARRTYEHHEVVWGARHADVLSEDPDGSLVLDASRFHALEPTEATEAFPYSWRPPD